MWQYTGNIIQNDKRYELMFDKLEVLMALSYAYYERRPEGRCWIPLGSFVYRSQNRRQVLEEIEKSIATLQSESPFVKSGIFGETVEECLQELENFESWVSQVASQMGIFR